METQKKKICAIISYRIMCLKTRYLLKKLSSDLHTHGGGHGIWDLKHAVLTVWFHLHKLEWQSHKSNGHTT